MTRSALQSTRRSVIESPRPRGSSNDGGIVIPSAFAVFRLMISSEFSRLLDGQICGFCATKNPVDKGGVAIVLLRYGRVIRDQRAVLLHGYSLRRWWAGRASARRMISARVSVE